MLLAATISFRRRVAVGWLLCLGVMLAGCAGGPGSMTVNEQPDRGGTDMLVLAPDTDPWGGTLLRVGEYTLLAAALHTADQMGLWKIGRDRKATRVGDDLYVGYHPDSVAVWDDRSVVVAVEGFRKIQLWDIVADPPRLLAEEPTAVGVRDLVAADLDGDGHQDLVLGSYGALANLIMWGKGDFEFDSPLQLATPRSGWHPVVVDWDDDGRLDIVWAALDSRQVMLARNLGERRFVVEQLLEVQGFNPRHVAVGDVTGNGTADLVVAVELGPAEVVIRNEGEEPEIRRIPNIVTAEDVVMRRVRGADSYFSAAVMEDGTIVLGEDQAVVFVRLGEGGFEKRWLPAGVLPSPIELFDVDGDGIEDLVVFNSGGGAGTGGVTVHFGPLWENALPIEQLREIRFGTS